MDINLIHLEKEMAKRTIKQYCSSWSELRYDEIRNKAYFIGKRSKYSETEILFPVNTNKILTYDHLKATIVDSGSSSLNFAVYGTDSTVVLYKAHLGLKTPVSLQNSEKHPLSACSDEFISLKKRKIDALEDSATEPTDQNKADSLTILPNTDISEFSLISDNDVSGNSKESQK